MAEVNETPSDFKPKPKAPSVDGSEIRLTNWGWQFIPWFTGFLHRRCRSSSINSSPWHPLFLDAEHHTQGCTLPQRDGRWNEHCTNVGPGYSLKTGSKWHLGVVVKGNWHFLDWAIHQKNIQSRQIMVTSSGRLGIPPNGGEGIHIRIHSIQV